MEFKNKVALVTGSSKGIGKQTIIEFAKKGANVVINYNNSQKEADELEQYIKNTYGVKTLCIKCDVSKEEEVKNMINEIITKFNKIDFVINNASIAIDTLFEDKTVSNFKKILDTNLIGTFNVCKHVEMHMKEKKYGKIVNVSSNNAIDSYYPMSIDYDASKAAVISLTNNLAVQFAPYINVNAVAPGWVNTEMNKQLDKEFIEEENKKILKQRFANPEEIAKVITFLCSEDANYINSTTIKIDGGKYV